MHFINQVPAVAEWWSRSSARQGASLALALAKAHHPDLNLDVVSSGFPLDPTSGEDMSEEGMGAIVDAASQYASRIERCVIIRNHMPTVVPPEDSGDVPQHRDFPTKEPFRACLTGALSTYPPPTFQFVNPETGETEDYDAASPRVAAP